MSLEAWEQADALGRAVEGGAFDEAGLSYKLGRALHSKGRPPASMLDEENLHLRAVERFLGERLKSNVFGYLYTRFNGYKDLIGNYAKPGALEGWWAMLAASRAQDRRREHELTLRAKKRREVAARREREGFSRKWRRG